MRSVFSRFSWLFALLMAIGGWVSFVVAGDLRVATFSCDVTPPLGQNIPSLKPMEVIDRPLLAKGIVLDDGRRRYILCAIDWCEICNSTYALFCRKIAEGAGTDPARVAVHANHQQAAPVADVDAVRLLKGTKGPPPLPDVKFFEQTADRVGAAAKGSLARLQPFDRIGSGEAKVEGVGSTRRIMGKDGKIHPRWSYLDDLALRNEAEGPIDPMLKTITLARGEKPLVRLHYYACHPQNLRNNRNVGYDFPGIARETLEKKENVFQVYFPGCGGDVLVGKYNDGTPAAQEQFARRLLAGMEAAISAYAFRFRRIDPLALRPSKVAAVCSSRPHVGREPRAHGRPPPARRQAHRRCDAGRLRRAGRAAIAYEQLADRPRSHPCPVGRMPGRLSIVCAAFGAGRLRGRGRQRRLRAGQRVYRPAIRGGRRGAGRRERRSRLRNAAQGGDRQAP